MEDQATASHVCLHLSSTSNISVPLRLASLLWVAAHKAQLSWTLLTKLWVHGPASWVRAAYRRLVICGLSLEICTGSLIWKGLRFWKNLRFCVFLCFLKATLAFFFFFFFLLRAVLVDFAVSWCRILPPHPGLF